MIPDDVLATSVRDLGLSIRSRKCMIRSKINTVGELIQRTADNLLESKNFGLISLTEVRECLGALGLHLHGEEVCPQKSTRHSGAKRRIVQALRTISEIKDESWFLIVAEAYLSNGKAASTGELTKVAIQNDLRTQATLLIGMISGKIKCDWDESQSCCVFSAATP